MTRKPRLLIVEDSGRTLWQLTSTFTSPPRQLAEIYGAGPFDVETASTGAAATRLLKCADANGTPYDVMTLDLGLPENEGDSEDPQVGIELLRSVPESQCTAIVVASVHTEVPTLIELIRTRSADFVPKPFDRDCESIFRSVVRAYQAGIRTRWLTIKQRLAEQLFAVQSRCEVADRLSGVVAEGLGTICEHVRELARQIEDRFQLGLSRDAEDPICQAIAAIERTADSLPRRCATLRGDPAVTSERLSHIYVDNVVGTALEKCWFGIAHHGLHVIGIPQGVRVVHSFRRDLELIVEEMLVNAIEVSARGQSLDIHVERNQEQQTLDVSVVDQAKPIDNSACDRIAIGEPLDSQSGREWGLWLAQRVARSIGARLRISPSSTGNTVTLHIPLTAND